MTTWVGAPAPPNNLSEAATVITILAALPGQLPAVQNGLTGSTNWVPAPGAFSIINNTVGHSI